MKFIIDAQLPFTLSKFLEKKGFDVIHTDTLPNKEFTTDNEIREISVKEMRIVITKDSDFLDSFFVKGVPPKLLLVSTGNIKNKALIDLFDSNIQKISELFMEYSFVELNNDEIIGHE
jgi:predicted nuclease of predicted toxin-antitoxin system